jgi:hypothetical protein
MKIPLLILATLLVLSLKAQKIDKDFVLTEAIYEADYNSRPAEPERAIGKALSGLSLGDLVEEEVLSREDMRGFALPLGVFKNDLPLNFERGMREMWEAKLRLALRREADLPAELVWTSLQAWAAMDQEPKKMNLSTYRTDMLQKASDRLQAWHQEEDYREKYSEARGEFMDLITENLSPNVLLGYNIQELIPPTHMTKDGTIKNINPLFKAYFLDRLLQEAGADFLCYFPARFDLVHSFGPFQFTPIAIADIKSNQRLNTKMKLYQEMSDLKTLEDHAQLAAIFAYNNWERLSYYLKLDGTLEQFNSYFKDYKNDEEKKRKLRILIAGMTAAMHHHPPKAYKMMRNYLEKNTDLNKIHYDLVEQEGNKQLQKYYRSAAEAYLILKVYHKVVD